MLAEITLGLPDGKKPVVEDGRCERRVRATFVQSLA
jgi:hypothetical protein